VEEHRVPTLFCESTVNASAQQQVALATGADLGGTLYVDSLSEADGPVPTFLDLIRYDLETIAEGIAR
jgi:manganese transport system substrate-binding protein